MTVKNFGELIRVSEPRGRNWALMDLSDPDSPRSFTLQEINSYADQVAFKLRAFDLTEGDAVAIASFNNAGYLIAAIGILRAKLIVVPVNHRSSIEVLRHIISDSNCKLALCDEPGADKLGDLLPIRHLADEAWFADETGDWTIPNTLSGSASALVLYTSGSTGLPKGVVHTHGGLAAMMDLSGTKTNSLFSNRSIVAAPLFHMNGLFQSLAFLAGGGAVVLMPRFEAHSFAQAIDQYKVESVTGVPSMISMLYNTPDICGVRDLSSVSRVSLGSAHLTKELIWQAEKLFPNASIANVYGTTEIGVPFGAHPAGLDLPKTSVGYPIEKFSVRLSGGSGNEGVLEVKTPGVMKGYLNRLEETEKKLKDRWYRTGDLFRRDENGFFFFMGREDDMFVCGGENIYPAEVERIIEKMGEVGEVCVVPVQDHRKGHVPVAFVVPTGEGNLSAEDVKSYALANGPPHLHPRHVFFRDKLPVTAINKIDRAQLKTEAVKALALI